MKPRRLIWASSALCLLIASCDKPKSAPAASAGGKEKGDALAAERAALEEERIALERQRLEEERAALEEEKAALEAEREAGLAQREDDADRRDLSLEGRQQALADREIDLSQREGDLVDREAGLSDRELELAGRESLDDWEPEYVDDYQEPVADYGTFYDDLQPYGSWFETPDYGYVYQPSIVVQDDSWRPYTRGRWACTNRGWTWVSDEPFGWACFHYGRWTLIAGRGWVWVPGDEWAPSWVCWREGEDSVGWAPLPPETLCYRGRGWNSSVEGDFGIGQGCFTFVHCRNMADPIWKHCLPVRENGIFIKKTKNITNIHIDRDRVVCGGPRFEKLRNLVGRPWPVYQLETDRFQGLRDMAHRNSQIRGNRLSVFAPSMNTRWNAELKPQKVSGKWEEVKVVRAEAGIKPEWTERFREARQKQKEQAVAWKRDQSASDETQKQQLQANREKVAEAQKTYQAKQRELVEARREKMVAKREERQASRGKALPGIPGRQQTAPQAAGPGEPAQGQASAGKPTLAERQRETAERMRGSRNRDQAGQQPEAPRTTPDRVTRPANPPETGVADNRRDRQPQPQPRQQEQQITPRRERNEGAVAQDDSRRQQLEDTRLQQQEQMRQRQEAARQDQERSRAEGEESTRRQQMEETRRQQQEAARGQAEQARQQQADRQRQMDENRQRQQDEARQQQEQTRRQTEENQRRQQQEEMQRRQQEQARQQQQEERARQQEEERARQQEQERARQEERAREQQERARQQEEQRARQQEEMQRRQEEARQQQEERARQQQEERARQQEEARRQQEERQRQQEESRRQQEERSRQEQDERTRKQQEDSQRQRGGR